MTGCQLRTTNYSHQCQKQLDTNIVYYSNFYWPLTDCWAYQLLLSTASPKPGVSTMVSRSCTPPSFTRTLDCSTCNGQECWQKSVKLFMLKKKNIYSHTWLLGWGTDFFKRKKVTARNDTQVSTYPLLTACLSTSAYFMSNTSLYFSLIIYNLIPVCSEETRHKHVWVCFQLVFDWQKPTVKHNQTTDNTISNWALTLPMCCPIYRDTCLYNVFENTISRKATLTLELW